MGFFLMLTGNAKVGTVFIELIVNCLKFIEQASIDPGGEAITVVTPSLIYITALYHETIFKINFN